MLDSAWINGRNNDVHVPDEEESAGNELVGLLSAAGGFQGGIAAAVDVEVLICHSKAIGACGDCGVVGAGDSRTQYGGRSIVHTLFS